MDGAPLHYRIDGAGPHLVLLHPVGLDQTCFQSIVTELSRRFTVLRVDLRGHGASPAPDPRAELADYAADVHAVLGCLQFAPAAVAGFSFGGMVAQELALAHPSDVSALVLGACPSTLPPDARAAMRERGFLAEREGMAAVVDTTLERWFTERLLHTALADPVRQRLLTDDVHGWATAWTAISNVETSERLRTIRVPTLCLAAGADRSTPPAMLRTIADNIPAARFVVIPDAPHMVFIEQPQAVASAISGFLEERPAARIGIMPTPHGA
jgi:3-oxoadipate enol-lactonase